LSQAVLSQAGADHPDPALADSFIFVTPADPATSVWIEGDGADTLNFDMDDFSREEGRVNGDGQEYRSFAAVGDDGESWSFLVDADVMLVDI
jgi:hypothetical protein